MSEIALDEIKQEAKELGIQFSANIGAAKLQSKIDDFYAKESATADIVEIDDEIEDEPEVRVPKKPKAIDARAIIAEQIREGKKTRVVKVTMVDKREASTATDAFFSNGDSSMRVPLDTFVEMPKILISQAEDAKALTHVNIGGNMKSKYTKKYVLEYK